MRRALLALPVLAALPAAAQVQQLWESPAAKASQNLGLTEVEVTWHRPAVKGRAIWGALVPYGQVWRAGANDATTVRFSTDVKVQGKPVPAGTYALFVLPEKDHWTVILNKEAQQWGAFFHKPEQDLLRFDLKPAAAPHEEWLAYGLELKSRDRLELSLHWEKLRIAFPVEADVEGLYRKHLETELAKAPSLAPKDAWATYFLAAKYWILQKDRLDYANGLLDKALAIQDSFWLHEWRGRLAKLQGRHEEAAKLVAEARDMSKGKAPKGYQDGLDQLLADWKAGR